MLSHPGRLYYKFEFVFQLVVLRDQGYGVLEDFLVEVRVLLDPVSLHLAVAVVLNEVEELNFDCCPLDVFFELSCRVGLVVLGLGVDQPVDEQVVFDVRVGQQV